jgi:uncharacterized repeat protein (TIGR01451 family)
MQRDGRLASMAGIGTDSSTTTRRGTLVLLAALLLALGLIGSRADAASAALCSTSFATPATLPDSSFEGHDGDQCDSSAFDQLVDWENVAADGEFAPGGDATAIHDDPVDSQFSIFSAPGQAASKEEYPDGWSFTAGAPNDKSDIINAWTYSEAKPNGDLFFHFAFETADKQGSVNYNFELNKLAETFRNKGGYDVPKRSNGDVLLAYDWKGGASATITLCRWQGKAGVDPWIEGDWVNCKVLDSTQAIGAVNLVPVTNFLPGADAGGDNVFAPQTFGEGSVDLTNVLDIGGQGQPKCVSFGSFWARTRTAPSLTAAPKDVLRPNTTAASNCGTVVIRKVTDPSPDPASTAFDFQSTGFTAPATGAPDTTPDAFQLRNGESETISSVVPGSYTVSERDPSAKEYALSDLQCDETGAGTNANTTTTSLATRTAAINVDPNETVTCTFTNTRLPADVHITKTADESPVSAGDQIGFAIDVSNTGPATAHNVEVTDELPTTAGLEWKLSPDVQGCSISNGTLTCSIGDLAVGAHTTIHVVSPTTKDSCSVIPNTASVTADNDSTPSQDDASVRVNCPDVTITKTAAKEQIGAGEDARFTIHVENAGDGTAKAVTVTDELPGGLDWHIVSPVQACAIADGALGCRPVDLATGESFDVTVEAATSVDECRTYENTAGYTSGNAGSGSASATVTCRAATVRVVKVVPGQGDDATRFSFTSDLTPNAGDQAADFELSEQDGAKSFTVEPGRSYDVTEADPRGKGYVLTAAGCRPTDPAPAAASASNENAPEDRTASTGTLEPGADVTCEFTNSALPSAIDVRKTPKTQEVYADGTAQYTYEVENTGAADLFTVGVTDDKCSNVTRGADAHGNGDDVLEPGEVWTYSCRVAASVLFAGSVAPVTNTVVAQATDRTEHTVQDSDTAVTNLLSPAIAIDKTGPATAKAGDLVTYTLDVTNPGNVSFADPLVVVTDELCQAPPALVGKNGDGSPATLDPGDRWTYQCQVQTASQQTKVDNVATVKGSDKNGRSVTAQDTFTTVLNQIEILPRQASAKLRGPSGCPTRATFAYVTGTEITKVAFYVDGKRRAVVRKADSRGRWKVQIVPKRLRYGRHKVRAVISFANGSTRTSSALSLQFSRCRPDPHPKFTG